MPKKSNLKEICFNSSMMLRRFHSNCSSKYIRYSSFLNASHQIRFLCARPRYDFSCIRGPDDAIALFHRMVKMQPLPSVIDFTRLLSSLVKMRRYTAALNMFDRMLERGVPINHYTLSIAIDCFCRLKRADFAFAILGGFIKRGFEPNVVIFNTLIIGLLQVGDMGRKAVEEDDCSWKLP